MRMHELFKPPEWSLWNILERIAYSVSVALFLALASIGGHTIYGWIIGG
jgi:hypothetical protein